MKSRAQDNQKAEELAHIAATAIISALQEQSPRETEVQSTLLAQKLVEQFARITPPEVDTKMHEIRFDSSGPFGGVSTVKPGNIMLNMRQLITAIASGIITISGFVAAPWTILFGGIVIWASLRDAATVKLSEHEAAVLWTMWKHKNAKNYVADLGLLEIVNEERARFDCSPLRQGDLERAIDKLLKVRCIQRSVHDSNYWGLIEWVRVPYN